MKNRHPQTLSTGDNNTVIALSETEVGKLFTGDTRSDIGSEAEKMKFANAVNGLVVRFIRLNEFSPGNFFYPADCIKSSLNTFSSISTKKSASFLPNTIGGLIFKTL